MQAGSSLGGGTVINWQNCLRTFPWVREQWAREHGLEGLDGPEFDGLPRPGHGADRRHRLVLRAERAAPAASGGLRGARLGLQADHPQRRPGEARPGAGRLRRLRRRHRLQAVGPEDLPGRRARAGRRTWSVNCRAERILVENGRAAGVEGAYAGPDGATARVVVRCTLRSWSRAARSSRRRCCCARGSAARPSATTCACTPSAACSAPTKGRRTRGGERRSPRSATSSQREPGRPRLPARGRPPFDRGSRPPRRPGSPAASTSRRWRDCATARC